MRAPLIVALLAVILPLAPRSSHSDAEGFIHDWLVLAPIAIERESGASETDKDFLKGEAAITPAAGDTAIRAEGE